MTKANSKKRVSKKKPRASKNPMSQVAVRNKPLKTLTDEALSSYFTRLNGHEPRDLYQLVIGEVEKPLLAAVMRYTNGNQSVAATILGINRGTLRKKLKNYDLMSG